MLTFLRVSIEQTEFGIYKNVKFFLLFSRLITVEMFQHWEIIKVVKSLILSKFAHLFIFLPKPSSQWKQQFRKKPLYIYLGK